MSLLTGIPGALWGARWISRRADAQMEQTRAALRSQHALTDPPVTPGWEAQLDADAVRGPAEEDLSPAGRHRAAEELMRATTYPLSPDRIARAKVPDSGADLPARCRPRNAASAGPAAGSRARWSTPSGGRSNRRQATVR